MPSEMLFFRNRVQFLLLTPVPLAGIAFLSTAIWNLTPEIWENDAGVVVTVLAAAGILLLGVLVIAFIRLIIFDGISRRNGKVRLEEWTPVEDLKYVSFAEDGRDNVIPMPYLFPVIGYDSGEESGGDLVYTYPRPAGSWSVTVHDGEYPLWLVGDYLVIPGAIGRTRRRCRRLAQWLGVEYREPKDRGGSDGVR